MPESTGNPSAKSSEVESQPGVNEERRALIGTAQASPAGQQQRNRFTEFPACADVDDEVVAAKVLVDVAVNLAQQFKPLASRVADDKAVFPLILVVLDQLVTHFGG